MIDKLTTNNNEIEYYYNIGSIHGDIRMMLNKYTYNEIFFNDVISYYEKTYGKVSNVNINIGISRIAFDIKGNTLKFQEKFAKSLYHVLSSFLESLCGCVDLFEKDNPKYKEIKENINILSNESYYITLFRTSFIKHENSTSCIIQL